MDVNDKEGSERASHVLLEDPVAARNVHGFVGDHRDVHLAQAAVLARGVDPGEVAEVRVFKERTFVILEDKSTTMLNVITRNLCYVRSEFCRFPCRWICLQGRAEQYITFFPYAV
jgi:hypothetical protein